MSAPYRQPDITGQLGPQLKQWRTVRGTSQLALSLESGVSQRHISFIESGRSMPGRATLLALAQVLDVPFRERNTLLLAAGYAPMYADRDWNDEDMRGIEKAIARMLKQQNPYPAIVMDRYWNVLMANDAAPRFFNRFVDLDARPAPRNILALMFDPAGMRPHIANWEQVAASLLQRVGRESVGRFADHKTQELIASLLAFPDVDKHWPAVAGAHATEGLPMVPFSFIKNGAVMNYFSMITFVAAPQNIAAQELRVECMFPADQETEELHTQLMQVVSEQEI